MARGLNGVHAERVILWFEQEQANVIEPDHLLESAGQLVNQRAKVPVRGDRLRYGQQGSMSVVCGIHLCHRDTLIGIRPQPAKGEGCSRLSYLL